MSASHPGRPVIDVMHAMRSVPVGAETDHLSLVQYMVEETPNRRGGSRPANDADLLEELGHDAAGVSTRDASRRTLRHWRTSPPGSPTSDRRAPYVSETRRAADLMGPGSAGRSSKKGRTSALDGIPERLSALARAHKVIARARSHGHAPNELGLEATTMDPATIGDEFLKLVATAEELGIDPEQEARRALRELEERVRRVEGERPGS